MHPSWPLRWLRSRHRRRYDELQHVVDRLTIPIPFTIEDFCAELAPHNNGRPVELVDLDSLAPPWSLWVAGDAVDWIVIERDTSPFARSQLVVREVGHLLLAPQRPDVRTSDTSDSIFRLRGQVGDHPAAALYDRFGFLLLQRAEALERDHDLYPATATTPATTALRCAVVLEGRP